MTDDFNFTVHQIRKVEVELRAYNDTADDLRWSRWIQETAAMIDRHGLWNILAAIAQLARDRENAAPEGSLAETDWRICAETLEEAAHQCDLRNAK